MPERPIECSACTKEICKIYKEITQENILISEMCESCPILEQKLHGIHPLQEQTFGSQALVCGTCRTSLESIRMGGLLGCSECYSVFKEVLIRDLSETEKIPKTAKNKKLLHLGKSPKKGTSLKLSSRHAALNAALGEAIATENYEQAAWLRDQIKALMEKKDGT